MINNINWNSIDSIKALSKTLEEMGLSSRFSKQELKDLETQIIEVSNATRSWNLKAVAEELKKNSELITSLLERAEHERSFT
jgi:hypothetical protein